MLSVEDLCPILSEVISGGENFDEANEQMIEFMKDINAIFPLMEICTNPELRDLHSGSLTFARQYFDKVLELVRDREDKGEEDPDILLDGLPVEYYSSLKEILVQLLVDEKKPLMQRKICDVIEVYSGFAMQFGEWPEISQLALEWMGNEQRLYIGLYLMNGIYGALTDEEQAEYAQGYGEICIQCMAHPDCDIRMIAVEAMYNILYSIAGDDEIASFPDLTEALKTLAHDAVYTYGDEKEIAALFGTLDGFLFDMFDFDDEAPDFCELALTIAGDAEVPLHLRVSVQQLYENGMYRIPQWFVERLELVLQTIVDLSVEACTEDREDTQYQFAGNFLSQLAENVDEEDFYATIIAVVTSLCETEDPVAVQVALFVLSCVIEHCADEVVSDPDLVVDLILKGLDSDDPFISADANEVLRGTARVASVCLSPVLDQIIESLIKRITDVQFLETLEVVLEKADHATGHLDSLLSLLLELVQDPDFEFKDSAIDCIREAIKQADVDDEFATLISPLMSILSEDISLAANVFMVFAVLARVAPNTVMSNIGEIMEFMFSVPEEYQANIVEPLFKFVEKFPEEMEAFAEQTKEVISAVMDIEVQDLTETEEITAVSAAIRCWAYLDPSEDFLTRIVGAGEEPGMIHWPYTRVQEASCLAFQLALPALAEAGLDFSEILGRFIRVAMEQEYIPVAVEMVNTIAQIISVAPQELVEAESEAIGELVLKALKRKAKCMVTRGQLSEAEATFIPAIYNLIYYWSSVIGARFAPFMGNFEGCFMKALGGANKNIKSLVILAFAEIGVTMEEQEIIDLAASKCLELLDNKHIIMRTNLMNALNVMIRDVPQVMQENQEVVKELVTSVLEAGMADESYPSYEAAAALWCTCVCAYDWEVDLDMVAEILSHIDIECDEDLGRTLGFANICAKMAEIEHEGLAEQTRRIAVRTFTLTNWYFNRAKPEVLEYLKSVLETTTPDVIKELTGYDHRMTQLILSRLE